MIVTAILAGALALLCLHFLTIAVTHTANRVLAKKALLRTRSEQSESLAEKMSALDAGLEVPLPALSTDWLPLRILAEERRWLLLGDKRTTDLSAPHWKVLTGNAVRTCPMAAAEPVEKRNEARAVSVFTCASSGEIISQVTTFRGNFRVSGSLTVVGSERLSVLGDLSVAKLLTVSKNSSPVEIVATGNVSIGELRSDAALLIVSTTGTVQLNSTPLDFQSCVPPVRIESKRGIFIAGALAERRNIGCSYTRDEAVWPKFLVLGELADEPGVLP